VARANRNGLDEKEGGWREGGGVTNLGGGARGMGKPSRPDDYEALDRGKEFMQKREKTTRRKTRVYMGGGATCAGKNFSQKNKRKVEYEGKKTDVWSGTRGGRDGWCVVPWEKAQ